MGTEVNEELTNSHKEQTTGPDYVHNPLGVLENLRHHLLFRLWGRLYPEHEPTNFALSARHITLPSGCVHG